MFRRHIKNLVCSSLVFVTTACGVSRPQTDGSSIKSIVDGNDNVFGLLMTKPRASEQDVGFEFQLCKKKQSTILPETCINPFQTSEGTPLTLSYKIFADAQEAQTYLRRVGYAKGAVATVAAGAATAAAIVYIPGAAYAATAVGGFGRPLFLALFGNGANGIGGIVLSYVFGTALTVGGAGYGGYEVGGASDRELSRNIPAITGDFYRSTTVRDVKPMLVRFAKTLDLKVDSRVSEF